MRQRQARENFLSILNMLTAKGKYLEGQGDLVSRLMVGISRVTTWVIVVPLTVQSRP